MHPCKYSKTLPPLRWGFLPALLLLLVLVHAGIVYVADSSEVFWYYANFGLSWDGLFQGKIWQVLSYSLLHGDWSHLLINLFLLCFAGARVSLILGEQKCIELIVFGVLVGGLMHLISETLLLVSGYGESHLIGLSGACFALIFALISISPYTRFRFLPLSRKNLGLGLVIGEVLLWLMHPGLVLPVFSLLGEQMTILGGAALFEISHACHIGGAMAGWWLANRTLLPAIA